MATTFFRVPVSYEGEEFTLVQATRPDGSIRCHVRSNTDEGFRMLQEDEDLEEYLYKANRHLLPA